MHLVNLYKAKTAPVSGLYILPKLKLEHIQLTSFSRMRVHLAAQVRKVSVTIKFTDIYAPYILEIIIHLQVLSESVANALFFYGDPATKETERFVRNMDKFLDCLNVRFRDEFHRRKKNNLAPYTQESDERLKVGFSYMRVPLH